MYKILFVDDELSVINGLKLLLNWEEYGIECIGWAHNGEEAMKIIASNKPDIIISDIRMPKVGGLELLKHLYEQYPEIKCILLSGYDEFEYVKMGLQYNIENYLLKPVSKLELQTTIEQIIEKLRTEERFVTTKREQSYAIESNILNLLIRDSINLKEFRDKSSLISLDIFHTEMQIVNLILRPTILHKDAASAEMSQHKASIYGITSNLLNDFYGKVFWNIDGFISIIFYLNQLDQPLNTFLDKLIESLQRHSDLDLICVKGSIVDSYRDLAYSYRTAVSASGYGLLKSDKTIIDYQEIHNKQVSAFSNLDVDTNELRKLISNQKKEDYFLRLNTLYDGINDINVNMNSAYRLFVIELFLIFKKRIEDLNGDITTLQEELDDVLRNIVLHNNQEVHQWLLDFSGLCFNYIEKLDIKTYSKPVHDIIKYVKEHYADEMSLKTLSQQFFFSPSYLGKLFKEETGMLFSDYLNQHRLLIAKSLLTETNLKSKDIALQTGFTNTNYFYNLFKKKEGVTPLEYRNGNYKF